MDPSQLTEVDQGKVQKILAQIVLPPEILSLEPYYEKDHSGDPAVWVKIYVRPEVPVDKQGVKRLSRVATAVMNALYDGEVGGLVYPLLKQAA